MEENIVINHKKLIENASNTVNDIIASCEGKIRENQEKTLERNIYYLLDFQNKKAQYNVVYQIVYNLTRDNKEVIKDILTRIFNTYLDVKFKSIDETDFISSFSIMWDKYLHGLKSIHIFFNYYDKHSKENEQTMHIGKQVFCERLSNDPSLQKSIKDSFMSVIEKSLNKKYIDFANCSLIKLFLQSFISSQLKDQYDSLFKTDLFAILKKYYESINLFSDPSISIVEQTHSFIDRESDKYRELLPKQTLSEIRELMYETCVIKHTDIFIDHSEFGLSALLRTGNKVGIRRIYELFSICNDNGLFREKFKSCIFAICREFAEQKLTSETYISALVSTIQRINDVVRDVFGNKRDYDSAANEALEGFMKDFKDSYTLLVKYINDMLVRYDSSGGEKSKNEFLAKVSAIRRVFFYVHDKENLELLYRKYMMTRLLTGRCKDMDAENDVLNMFNAECGFMYVHKLKMMLNDMKYSEEMNKAFEEKCKENSILLPIPLSVSVLTSKVWTPRHEVLTLPKVVSDACRIYETFYCEENPKKKLTWYDNLGIAEVLVTISPKSEYTIKLNGSQFVVLYNIFCNKDGAPTLRYVFENTGLPFGEVIRHLFLFSRIRLITVKDEKRSFVVKNVSDFGTLENADKIVFAPCEKFKYKSSSLNLSTVKEVSAGGGRRSANKRKRHGDSLDRGANKQVSDDKTLSSVNSAIFQILKSSIGSTFEKLNEMIIKSVPDADTEMISLCLKQLITKGFIKKEGDKYFYCE